MAELVGALALSALGVQVGAGILIIGISSTAVASAVGTVILVGGAIGLQLLLTRPPPASGASATGPGPALAAPEALHQPLKQPIPPRMVGYGRNRLAGSYVLFEAKDGISYDVIAFHHGQIGGIVGYYLNDDVVTVENGTGFVDALGDGRYTGNAITIKTRLGLSTETAYSEITTPLSTIWTANHRGDGLASLAMICAKVASPTVFASTFPRGLPVPSVVADCSPIFDPRDGTQSRTDSTTWKTSANPVLQMIDFLTGSDRGMGFNYDELIAPALTRLMAQADICDVQVLRADAATEARYASNGSFPLDSDPADVISSILDTCDGWISQNGDGSLSIVVGHYIPPTVMLESKHIRGCAMQYGVAEEEAINELTMDYTEPKLDYKTAPGQPWRNEQDISERGRTLSQRLALPWVCSHAQARRLAKRKDAQNNATLRGTITTTLYGIRGLGDRWILIRAPDLPDLENVVVEVRGITIDLLNASCQIKFISINPNAIDAWDPATEEGSAPTIPAKLIEPPAPVPQNISAIGAGGGIWVSFDDLGRSDLTFQMSYTFAPGGGTSQVSSSFMYGGRPTAAFPNFPSGFTYTVALRSITPGGAMSSYSSTTTVTL